MPLAGRPKEEWAVAALWGRFWRMPTAMFLAGWMLQFAGHIVEGKPPEFFKDWRFLLVGCGGGWRRCFTRGET